MKCGLALVSRNLAIGEYSHNGAWAFLKLAQLKEDLKGADAEKIKKSTEELTQAAHKLAEAVYKAQAAQQQTAQAAGAKAQPDAEQTASTTAWTVQLPVT